MNQHLADCVNEYFEDDVIHENADMKSSTEDPIYNGYKAVLDTKSTDETLVNSYHKKYHVYKIKKNPIINKIILNN